MGKRAIAVLFVISWFSLAGQMKKHKGTTDYIAVIDSWKVLRVTGVNVRRPPSEVFTINVRSKRNMTIDTVYAFWKGKALKGKLIRNNNMTDKAVVRKGENLQLNFIDVPEMRKEDGRLTGTRKENQTGDNLKVYISFNGEMLSLTVHPKERKQLPEVLPQ
jgi:hypothetical protein